jgi:hypothetical protein
MTIDVFLWDFQVALAVCVIVAAGILLTVEAAK